MLRALSAADLLDTWEHARAQPPLQRALVLLSAACPDAPPLALAQLSLGRRDAILLTLREWVRNLEAEWDRAVGLTSPGRARVWRLYMAGSALAFERNRIGVNQVLAVRPGPGGVSGLPATRDWLDGS